ncbi:MAG: hypothetical protein A3I14_03560 [Candidatus Rokubacteria bacterium RIFCSPLOWO2_02_FULL_73_56]|nr:MAG: hypothetical protein A3D33_05500 [Candidatus Rokubacteria bacterium RIFCSPHIGHO2_02_FULL_73_26]OGL07636.1 MAG: hypothetical protein A3I14_03560 [Candidatus Rokubacteria bacterium RIFCSPLOWO2_02_FULL_73_56]
MTRTLGRPQPAERRRGTRCCEGVAPRGALDEALERAAADFDVLAHPVRLRLLEILARRGGEVCVCDLEHALPVKQPTISHHLRLLRQAGLVDTARKGLFAYYYVEPAALAALRARVGQALEALAAAPGGGSER